MKITKSQLKQIIKEEIESLEYNAPLTVSEELSAENFGIALSAFQKFLEEPAVMAALAAGGIAGAVNTIKSKFSTPRSTPTGPSELKEEENNPWAICTAQVGREDEEKYEKCVKSIKKQNKGK